MREEIFRLARVMGVQPLSVCLLPQLPERAYVLPAARGHPAVLTLGENLLQDFPGEWRAVVAHELAHLARHHHRILHGTLTFSLLLLSLSLLLFLQEGVALLSPLGILLLLAHTLFWLAGGPRLLRRWAEGDADRLAARVVGLRLMGEALGRESTIPYPGWRPWHSHPSPRTRLARLTHYSPLIQSPPRREALKLPAQG